MPTAVLEYVKATFDDPNKLGDQGPLSRPAVIEFPQFKHESATKLLDYVVPAGRVVDLKNLLLMVLAYKPISVDVGGQQYNVGRAYLDVDGTDKAEIQPYVYVIGVYNTINWTYEWRSRDRVLSIGEGVDFTVGQVIKIKFTGVAPVAGLLYPLKIKGQLHGKAVTGGAVDLQMAMLRTPDAGSSVDVISYTVPANGFRLLSWDVTVWMGLDVATFQVFVNGSCVQEIPYMRHSGGMSNFNNNGQPRGPIALMGMGGWGMNLSHGDRVEVFAHAMLDVGHAATACLVGKSTTETYPAAGDVRSGTTYGAAETNQTGTLVVGGGAGGISRSRAVNP